MTTKRVHLSGHKEALSLFGQNDAYLRELEGRYHVQFFVRPSALPSGEGLTLAVRGKNPQVEKAIAALELRRQNPQSAENHHATATKTAPADPNRGKDVLVRTVTGHAVVPRTEHQKEFIQALHDYDVVIGVGPAGTGKTFLSVAYAAAQLQAGRYQKIVLTRPVVEAGEKLGFLPGDFYEKVHPYLMPLYDSFYTILGPDRFRLLRDDEVIEIAPLAYMRGRTLDNAVIILDEAQNTTPEQMKMFLTRMGQNSKVIVNGDLTQIDLENKTRSGLVAVSKILKGVEGIFFSTFTGEDIMRHPVVRRILDAFDNHNNSHP